MNSSPRQLEALRAAMEARDATALSQFLLEDWHDAHEDIAFELGLIGDPRTVGALSKAVRTPFAYLVEWGNLQAFQRKCAYALARIGTPESRLALESLASEADPDLREYGEEGLGKWPLPYRP